MPRILIIDTVYPDFIKTLPPVGSFGAQSYRFDLEKVMRREFGTADFYSTHLRAVGWDAIDVIANHSKLQELWVSEHDRAASGPAAIALDQISYYKPDVVFLQDLSFFSVDALKYLASRYTLWGQCSCPMPSLEKVRLMQGIFTSFPHYVTTFNSLGVQGVYMPLAFDDGLLNRITMHDSERIHGVAFVGGVGRPSHWKEGMSLLETVATEIPTSRFWGYGYELLDSNDFLRKQYLGPAFGLDMFKVYGQSKIVINRHGEVAQGFANNMRMFEATGMGALLMTGQSPNLSDFFSEKECVAYSSKADAIDKLRYYLAHEDERREIAWAGQQRTLRDHTYTNRMSLVSEVLKECLASRVA